jgi:hypothetical protein
MSKYGIRIVKPGINKDVMEAEPKEMAVSGDYDSFKIAFAGKLDLTVPEHTWYCNASYPVSPGPNDYDSNNTFNWVPNYWESTFYHGLGYVPMYNPGVYWDSLNGTYAREIPNDDDPEYTVVNYLPGLYQPQCGPWGLTPFYIFYIGVTADSNYLRLRAHEFVDMTIDCALDANDYNTYAEVKLRVYYTIFYNRADEEFNLL